MANPSRRPKLNLEEVNVAVLQLIENGAASVPKRYPLPELANFDGDFESQEVI